MGVCRQRVSKGKGLWKNVLHVAFDVPVSSFYILMLSQVTSRTKVTPSWLVHVAAA